jgi:NAD(P)-dependent dehydrogenase (short-subunit alcohol dehydrogenase family)
VTGASRGIGAAVCLKLAKAGFIVLGLARNVDQIQKLSDELESDCTGRIVGRACDVENESDIKEAFEWVRKREQRD